MKIRPRNYSIVAAGLAAATILLLAGSLFGAKKPKPAPPSEPAAPVVVKPEIPDLEFITRLRDEEFNHGEVMDIMSYITDDIGPRLTGSPNMKKANEWTRDQFAKWGMVNAHVEAWGTFGRGWAFQLCEVRMLSPDIMQFLALPEAWTPGTNGPIRGEVTQLVATTSADLEKYKGKLGGKIVLIGDARIPDPSDKPLFRREEDADLTKIAEYQIPGGGPGGPGGPNAANRQTFAQRRQFQQDLEKLLTDEHVMAVLDLTRLPGEDGTIFVQSGGSYDKGKTIGFPRITLAVEHYGR